MNDKDERLSRIETRWSLVRRVHEPSEPEVREETKAGKPQETKTAVIDAKAATELLSQYQEPIRKYLRGALRDEDAANEVYQQFCLRFARGDFHRADPSRGRFRNLIKTSLSNLVKSYQSRARRIDLSEIARYQSSTKRKAAGSPPDLDANFDSDWLAELVERAKKRLAENEKPEGPPYSAILLNCEQADNPSSEKLAALLSAQLAPRTFSPDQVRKMKQRAREKLADLLLEEVCRSLRFQDIADLAQELADLGLLEYCRDALERKGSG